MSEKVSEKWPLDTKIAEIMSEKLCLEPKVSEKVSEKLSEIIKLSISQEFISASDVVVPGKKSATLTDDLGPKTFRIYKVKR